MCSYLFNKLLSLKRTKFLEKEDEWKQKKKKGKERGKNTVRRAPFQMPVLSWAHPSWFLCLS